MRTAAVRLVRRLPGSELEVTGRGQLSRDPAGRHRASLNLTLPVDGYKGVNTAWQLRRLPHRLQFRWPADVRCFCRWRDLYFS